MDDEGTRRGGKRNGGNVARGDGGTRGAANQDRRVLAIQLALVCRAKLGRVPAKLEKAIFAWLVLGDLPDDVRACCEEAAREPTAKTPAERYALFKELVRIRRKARPKPPKPRRKS